MSQEFPDSARVFDAAKLIVETLKDLDKAHQERALRFASESLGLTPALQPQTSVITGQGAQPLGPRPMQVGSAHATDIKQFTASKAPKTDQQFAAVVAYYYRFEAPEPGKKESIAAEDLIEAARLAGRRRPNNASFTLNNAKNAGYLDNAERGKFRISTVGENLVAVTLPGTDAAGANNRKSAKRKAKGKNTRRQAGRSRM